MSHGKHGTEVDGRRESQITEIILFRPRIARIERMDLCYPLDPCSYNLSIFDHGLLGLNGWICVIR